MTIDDVHLPFFIRRIISLILEEDGRKTFPREMKLWKFPLKTLIYEGVALCSFTSCDIIECCMLQHSILRQCHMLLVHRVRHCSYEGKKKKFEKFLE
jgi:hypothetical protein